MSKLRGIYEKVPGSSVWWIRYADSTGKIRREKVGNKGAAIKLYQKRKTEVLQGVKLPENFKVKPVTFGELAQAALDYSKAHKSDHRHDDSRMKLVLKLSAIALPRLSTRRSLSAGWQTRRTRMTGRLLRSTATKRCSPSHSASELRTARSNTIRPD